jgi:transposase
LADQGYSYLEIARQTGVHRVSVSAWLRAEAANSDPPAPAQPEVVPAGPLAPPVAPPAPWTSWDEVRAVCAALKEQRGLFLRRPDHLSTEQHEILQTLLASPIGATLAQVRAFLTDWYAIWHDADHRKRSLADATARYVAWRQDNPDSNLVPLRRVRAQITPERFAQLSQFLRRPTWEATNNGAERAGRLFRHHQGPHFTLRTPLTLEGLLAARLQQRRERLTAPAPPVALCWRGRRRGDFPPRARAA